MTRTRHDARNEKRNADAAMEARHAETPAAKLEAFNAAQREAALADCRVGLLTRKGRVVAYTYVNGRLVEGTVAQVRHALDLVE